MPIYEYRCAKGHTSDGYASFDDYQKPITCKACGLQADRIISIPSFVLGDIAGYRCVATGKWIGSRSAHRDHVRDNGFIEVGNERLPQRKPETPGGLREDIQRAIETSK